jgi:hypothetical protein
MEQLRYLQLYDTNLSFFQQFIFDKETMNALTETGFPLKEYFSQNCNTAEDDEVNKTLIEELSRQARPPMMVVSVDTVQCYGRVKQVIITLVWYAVLRKLGPITVPITHLQTMIFF